MYVTAITIQYDAIESFIFNKPTTILRIFWDFLIFHQKWNDVRLLPTKWYIRVASRVAERLKLKFLGT